MKSNKSIWRKMICLAALIMSIAIVLAAPDGARAGGQTFTDLPAGDPYYPFVNYLVQTDHIQGYTDGSFRPGQSLTRAEAAALLARAAKLDQTAPAGGQAFTDLNPGHWAYNIIQAATQAGLIQGYPDGAYRPEAPVTRAEACALLLRLAGQPLPAAVTLDQPVTDVETAHWASTHIAVALQAGLFTLDQENTFAPEAPATRAQFARGLATMLNIDPGRNKTDLTGTLTPVKGKTTITKPGQSPEEISAPTVVTAGDMIKTSISSQAELDFPDGSGLKLDSLTTLTISEARGQTTILADGTPGIRIDYLRLDLAQGKLFGALARTAVGGDTQDTTNQPTSQSKYIEIAYAGQDLPPGAIVVAEETTGEDLQWWQEAYAEKTRVEVDMPWGVATVRGTFWMNYVGPGFNATNVYSGSVQVSSGGQTVNVGPGQGTNLTSPGSPPPPPQDMTDEEREEWEENEDWVEDREGNIQQNQSIISGPGQGGTGAGNGTPGSGSGNSGSSGSSGSGSSGSGSSGGGGGGGGGDKTGPKEKQDLPPGTLTEDLVHTFNRGDITVTIPAGTVLGEGAAVTVQEYRDVSDLPEGVELTGQAVDINITGVPAGTVVTIGLKCTPGKEKSAIYYYNPGTHTWEYQNSVLDTSNWIVTAGVRHFSLYAVLEDNAPPEIKSIDPSDKEDEVPLDKDITITFNEIIESGDQNTRLFLQSMHQNIRLSGNIDLNVSIHGTVMLLTPAGNLDYNNTYTLELPAGLVKDSAGNLMEKGQTISFTTVGAGSGLQSLVLSAGELTPAFNSAVTRYTAVVGQDVENVTVTATATDPQATVTINGTPVAANGTQGLQVSLGVGETTITIEVTASGGGTVETYTVIVTRASGNADLSGLAISPGNLAPVFDAAVTAYTAEVDNEVENITVNVSAADPEAAITITTINSNAHYTGEASATVPLNVGANTITIRVAGREGSNTKTYTVTVTRAPTEDDNNTPEPETTVAGQLAITPENATEGDIQDITLTYTPGENLTGGTVVFSLPDGITAIAGYDTIEITGLETSGLITGQINAAGKTVTINNVTVDASQPVILTLTDKIVPQAGEYQFSVTADADGTGTGKTPSAGAGSETGTFTAVPTPVATIAGSLAIDPEKATAGENKDITLTYTPGENLAGGTVVFSLPAGISANADAADTISIADADPASLIGSQLTGQTVTITGVTATTNKTVVLKLTGKTMPTDGVYQFSVTADADGTGAAKTPSAGAGNEAKAFTVTPPAVTVAGQLVIAPENDTVGEGKTITLTYTPGENLTGGTVTFSLPSGISFDAGDTINIAGQLSSDGQTVTISGVNVEASQPIILTLNNKTVQSDGAYQFSVTADADGTGAAWTASAGTGNEAKTFAVAAPEATVAGQLAITPENAITGEQKTITLTYTPGESLDNGTVTFSLPNGISFDAGGDTINIDGQLSVNGQIVTISGVTVGAGQTIILTLNNKTVPAGGAYQFSVIADADGTGDAKTPSAGAGSEAKTFVVAAPVATVAGQLAITPENATEGDIKNITLTYTPGANLAVGTVVFTLAGINAVADAADTISIAGADPASLSGGQISGDERIVTITGVTATTNQTVVLKLTGKTVPSEGAYQFSVTADADGTGAAKTASAGAGSEAKTFVAEKVVNFADAALKTAVRSTLGIPSEESISVPDMLKLEVLSGEDLGIENLNGLECAANLRELHLSKNLVTNIGPLTGLTGLNILDLSDNKNIVDIAPLAGLINLQYLDLSGNKIQGIGALVANAGLGPGDTVNLDENYLDLDEEGDSQDSQDIQTLRNREVSVSAVNQKDSSGSINAIVVLDPPSDYVIAGEKFNLKISNATSKFNGELLNGKYFVKVKSNNPHEGMGFVYFNRVHFTNGAAEVPIRLYRVGNQTLTIKITGVTKNRPSITLKVIKD